MCKHFHADLHLYLSVSTLKSYFPISPLRSSTKPVPAQLLFYACMLK